MNIDDIIVAWVSIQPADEDRTKRTQERERENMNSDGQWEY